jgi:hypothetical protein
VIAAGLLWGFVVEPGAADKASPSEGGTEFFVNYDYFDEFEVSRAARSRASDAAVQDARTRSDVPDRQDG